MPAIGSKHVARMRPPVDEAGCMSPAERLGAGNQKRVGSGRVGRGHPPDVIVDDMSDIAEHRYVAITVENIEGRKTGLPECGGLTDFALGLTDRVDTRRSAQERHRQQRRRQCVEPFSVDLLGAANRLIQTVRPPTLAELMRCLCPAASRRSRASSPSGLSASVVMSASVAIVPVTEKPAPALPARVSQSCFEKFGKALVRLQRVRTRRVAVLEVFERRLCLGHQRHKRLRLHGVPIDSTLRSISMPALLRPSMNRPYVRPCSRTAALMR